MTLPACTVTKRIAVDCLTCGHCVSMPESQLADYGLEPDASLVLLTKKLVCTACGGRSVRAFRFVDDGEQHHILQESPPIALK